MDHKDDFRDTTVDEIAEHLAEKLEEKFETANAKSVGSVKTADGRLAEVTVEVQADKWEWIRPEEDLQDMRLDSSSNSGGDEQ